MESERKWIERAAAAKLDHVLIKGKRCGVYRRADFAFIAKVMEIGRQTVADVDH